MVKSTKFRLEESDFPLVEGNKHVFDVDTDFSAANLEVKVDLDSLVANQGSFRKLVAGF